MGFRRCLGSIEEKYSHRIDSTTPWWRDSECGELLADATIRDFSYRFAEFLVVWNMFDALYNIQVHIMSSFNQILQKNCSVGSLAHFRKLARLILTSGKSILNFRRTNGIANFFSAFENIKPPPIVSPQVLTLPLGFSPADMPWNCTQTAMANNFIVVEIIFWLFL